MPRKQRNGSYISILNVLYIFNLFQLTLNKLWYTYSWWVVQILASCSKSSPSNPFSEFLRGITVRDWTAFHFVSKFKVFVSHWLLQDVLGFTGIIHTQLASQATGKLAPSANRAMKCMLQTPRLPLLRSLSRCPGNWGPCPPGRLSDTKLHPWPALCNSNFLTCKSRSIC